jgi:hypothetical protein
VDCRIGNNHINFLGAKAHVAGLCNIPQVLSFVTQQSTDLKPISVVVSLLNTFNTGS